MSYVKLAFFMVILLACIEVSQAAIPLIEFNITSSQREGILEKLPHRYLPIKNAFVWTINDTTYINLSKLVELPSGGFYTFSSNNPKNIIVNIDQGKRIVAVKPRPGWYGEENVIIYLDGTGSEAIKSVESVGNDLLISNIDLDQLDRVFFDDTLYSLFLIRMDGIFDARRDVQSRVDVNGTLDAENNILMLKVGDDVEILTGFYDEDGKSKPSIRIVIDAALADYQDKVGHCSDGIRNYDELDVDCGGECSECIARDSGSLLINLIIIILFSLVVGYVVIKYGKLPQKKIRKKVEMPTVILSDVRMSTIRDIKEMRSKITDDNVKKDVRLLSRLVRKYFGLLLHIKYSFTYNELEKELANRKIRREEKERLLRLFKRISIAEFGKYKINRIALISLVNEAADIITRLELGK